MTTPDKSRRVTVCDACFRASCWAGTYRCAEYRTAGTTERTVGELDAMGREAEQHYSTPALPEAGAASASAVHLTEPHVSDLPSVLKGGK